MIIAADMGGALNELDLLADLSPPSRTDGEYVDATIVDGVVVYERRG